MKKPELEAAQTAVDAAQVETSNAWQEAMEEIAYYLSVGVEGCTPDEAVARIKKAATDGARVQMERAERAEAAIAPMVETAQNQQEEIHRLWVTFSKAAEILGLDPQKERRIPRPPSDTFTQAISRLVAERDVALAALKEAQEQEPVAWLCDKEGRFDVCPDSVKKLWLKVGQQQNTQCMMEVVPCRVEHYNIPLYAGPVTTAPAVTVPAEWREVLTELADDLSIELDMRYQSRSHYPSEQRKYENEMQLIYRARALLQSVGEKK